MKVLIEIVGYQGLVAVDVDEFKKKIKVYVLLLDTLENCKSVHYERHK